MMQARRTLQCVLALAALINCCSSIQQQQQPQQPQQPQPKPQAPQQTQTQSLQQPQKQQTHQALVSINQHQPAVGVNRNGPPQQSQSLRQEPGSSGSNQAATQPGAKPNHRLVNKLKDARHRRRHRHQRHRQQKHHQLVESSAPLIQDLQAASSTTLTALESIVEEVARVGQQLPATLIGQQQSPAQQQSPMHQQAQQQQQSPVHSPEMALDSSLSHQQSVAQSPNMPLAPLAPVVTRTQMLTSRGFFLTDMLSKIMNVLNVTEFAHEMRDGISSRASCMACNAVVGLFMSPFYSKDVFSSAIRTVCSSFKIQSHRVCAGLVLSFEDDFEYIRKNTKLSRDEICGVVFGADCARRPTYHLFWTVPIPESGVPKLVGADQTTGMTSVASSILNPAEQAKIASAVEDAPDLLDFRRTPGLEASPGVDIPAGNSTIGLKPDSSDIQRTPKMLSSSSNNNNINLKQKNQQVEYIFQDNAVSSTSNHEAQTNKISSFVHLTDIHVDPYYETGALNDCNEPLCCRASSGPVAIGDKRRQAGRWGDYGNCDSPIRTIRNALNRIRTQHSNAEYWIWTGDISPHDIWNISKSEAANNVRLVTKMVRDYSNGVPVFPVIGNHEAHPVNSFSPPEIKGKFSMSWLYDLLAEEWSVWLPKEALRTLRIGGYYRLKIRKGFRIIALNTNYCARLNPWSFYDPVDPGNQLKWLVDELLDAEMNQDKVHIIGHVPPDNRECTQAWLFNFINIVDRFKDIILAQFYGHTHRDEWRIMYSMKRVDEVIGIQYIGPSLTPFTENNPAYRIYHQDQAGHLIDSHTYFFNLTEANESPISEPKWQFSYSTQTHLNMTRGLQAIDFHHYVQRLHEDDFLFDEFFRNFYRTSDVKMGQICKAKCKYRMLSDLRLSHPYKTKPKRFLANRKTSNHMRDRHEHHHLRRLRHPSPE